MSVLGITASSTVLTNTAKTPVAEEGFSFFETIIDTLNPLHHIPIVSNIYRSLTGDTQSAISNIAGGTLFGGPVGGGLAAASEVFKAITSEITSPEPTQTALAATKSTSEKASRAYGKTASSTKSWLYPGESSTEVVSNLASTHKIKATTKEWLTA